VIGCKVQSLLSQQTVAGCKIKTGNLVERHAKKIILYCVLKEILIFVGISNEQHAQQPLHHDEHQHPGVDVASALFL
jgi:hypothetical protein